MTTWDKTIMTLQADLLGANALGIRNIVCETGNPPLLGDYPAVDGIWEVDSLGLVALLAGLNAGRDSTACALATKTSFCIGGRGSTRARRTPRPRSPGHGPRSAAGAQFLVTRPVYELDPLRRMVSDASAASGSCVCVAPLRSFEEADYLAHEVPDVTCPPPPCRDGAGRASGGEGAGLELAANLLAEARPLVSGVVLTTPRATRPRWGRSWRSWREYPHGGAAGRVVRRRGSGRRQKSRSRPAPQRSWPEHNGPDGTLWDVP